MTNLYENWSGLETDLNEENTRDTDTAEAYRQQTAEDFDDG